MLPEATGRISRLTTFWSRNEPQLQAAALGVEHRVELLLGVHEIAVGAVSRVGDAVEPRHLRVLTRQHSAALVGVVLQGVGDHLAGVILTYA